MTMNSVTAQALRERLAQEEAAHASAIARRVELLGDLAMQDSIIEAHARNIAAYRADIPAPATEAGSDSADADADAEGDAS